MAQNYSEKGLKGARKRIVGRGLFDFGALGAESSLENKRKVMENFVK